MAAQTTESLPHGYHLGDYVIDRKIGGGGFSLVYLAFDIDGQPVAIKEYLPGGVVRRGELGVEIESICAENATCGKCMILIEEGRFEKYNIDSKQANLSPVGAEERAYLERIRALVEARAPLRGVLLYTVAR